jgi:uncharacterized protein
MQIDDFEWDDAKAASNLRDHGVSFEVARLAFNDIFAFDRIDRREHYSEDRYAIVGMVKECLLFVAYTFREGRIRIISARHASPFERRLYHEHNAKK